MPWEPLGRLVRARVDPDHVRVVHAEMWDPETGDILVMWPTPNAEFSAPNRRFGPITRRTQIAAGEWWELEGES